ncbi:hypothetical protein BMR85_003910 [Achromobacter sp. KAs 3-5]|nr:hypothetical protein BMR85_003910 [Achromobacter sp. KAs 3-5]
MASLARVLCAVLGGYALATVGAIVLAQLLPIGGLVSPAIGVVVASLLSFLIYTVAALWVFAARDAWRWLLTGIAVLAVLAWAMGIA